MSETKKLMLFGTPIIVQQIDDAEAIKFASVWSQDAPMELWCEDALVRRWTFESE